MPAATLPPESLQTHLLTFKNLLPNAFTHSVYTIDATFLHESPGASARSCDRLNDPIPVSPSPVEGLPSSGPQE